MRRRRPLARSAVWGLVVAGHLALLLLLAGISARRNPAAPDDRAVMVMMNLPPPAPAMTPPLNPSFERARLPHTESTRASPTTSITPEAQAPPVFAEPGGRQHIDWSREATQAAAAAGSRLSAAEQRECHPSDRRGALPAHCRRPRAPPPWEPEPQRAGFSGLLPWVRIGKRCVVGLGFFGCNVDELPQANGHLLDEMKNPERLRSSVPDPTP